MLPHDLRLAWLSFRRNPVLAVLMISAIAAGIGASMIAITLYHAKSGNPIWWKNDRLFAVAVDNRPDDPEYDKGQPHPEYPPFQMTYRDARAIYESDIPERSVMMFASRAIVDPGRKDLRAFRAMTRVTTADFFAMFDVPFLYGAGWARSDDATPEPVVVISRKLNEKLFGGANSVGRSITLDGHDYRIAGVIDSWMPQPKFYDLSGHFSPSEDVFMAFGWTVARELSVAGSMWCMSDKVTLSSFADVLASDCIWLQFWAELVSQQQRARYQQFIDNYVSEQKEAGRFPRPLNNRLSNVSTWLEMNDVIGDESRLQVVLALLFLLVCILNTLGLMLAKFLGAAPITGLRRALGATRRDIIRQHLTEVVAIAVVGGIAGIGLAIGGLWLLRVLLYLPMAVRSGNPDSILIAQSLSHLDGAMVAVALAISLLTGILAGIYPAWRIGRMSPAVFLKTQ